MKNFLAVIGGIVVGFIALLIIVYVSNSLNTPGGLDPFTSGKNSSFNEPAPRKSSAAEIASKITASFARSKPGSFRAVLDEENKIYKVDMWNNFTREEIAAMQEGEEQDRWVNSCNALVGICDDIQDQFNNGHPEIKVVLSAVDTEDHDYVFVTASRGEIKYDVVRGIDLWNDSEG